MAAGKLVFCAEKFRKDTQESNIIYYHCTVRWRMENDVHIDTELSHTVGNYADSFAGSRYHSKNSCHTSVPWEGVWADKWSVIRTKY